MQTHARKRRRLSPVSLLGTALIAVSGAVVLGFTGAFAAFALPAIAALALREKLMAHHDGRPA